MEEHFCTFSDCKNPAKYICDCNLAQFCKMHISEHKKLPTQPHSIEPLYFPPNPEMRLILLKEISKAKVELSKNKTKLIESLSQMISVIDNLFKSVIIKTEYNLNKILLEIKNTQKISKLEKDPLLKSLTLESKEDIEDFQLDIKNLFKIKILRISQVEKKIWEEVEYFRKKQTSYMNLLMGSQEAIGNRIMTLPSINIKAIKIISKIESGETKIENKILEQPKKKLSSNDYQPKPNQKQTVFIPLLAPSSKLFKNSVPDKDLIANSSLLPSLIDGITKIITIEPINSINPIQQCQSASAIFEPSIKISQPPQGASTISEPSASIKTPQRTQIDWPIVYMNDLKDKISPANHSKKEKDNDESYKNKNTCVECGLWKTLDEYSIACPLHYICNNCRIKNVDKCNKCERFYSNSEKETLEVILISLS